MKENHLSAFFLGYKLFSDSTTILLGHMLCSAYQAAIVQEESGAAKYISCTILELLSPP